MTALERPQGPAPDHDILRSLGIAPYDTSHYRERILQLVRGATPPEPLTATIRALTNGDAGPED